MATQKSSARVRTGPVGMCAALLRAYFTSSIDNWANAWIDKRKIRRRAMGGVRFSLAIFDELRALDPEVKRRLRPLVGRHAARVWMAAAWLSVVGLALTIAVALLVIVIAFAPIVVHVYFTDALRHWTLGGFAVCLVGMAAAYFLFSLPLWLRTPLLRVGGKLTLPALLAWAWIYTPSWRGHGSTRLAA